MPAQFYTYLWLREDGTPYYAGKGMGIRAYRSHRMGKAPSRDRILVQDFASEQDALVAEMFLIAAYGREDQGTGCLLNLTDGGENPPSFKGKTRSEQWLFKIRGQRRTQDSKRLIGAGIAEHYKNDTSLIGKRFGRLVVVDRTGVDKFHSSCWEVLCDCGSSKVIVGASLKNGYTKSCGCFNKESLARNRRFNHARTVS